MQKIISLNMEMHKHYDLVFPFIKSENPDILCLQEAPEEIIPRLTALNYHVSFAPMFEKTSEHVTDTCGVMLATRIAHTSKTIWYVKEHVYNGKDYISYPCLMGDIETLEGTYHIGVIHGPVTKDGKEDDFQTQNYTILLDLLKKEPAHILCGDFNMPRGYNSNYTNFTPRYTDTIPTQFTSSLDRTLHTSGTRTDLDAPMFDIYMVDYIFTQQPYSATDVRLQFGVSDHAAVVAHIERREHVLKPSISTLPTSR